jgi:hypothetical protein
LLKAPTPPLTRMRPAPPPSHPGCGLAQGPYPTSLGAFHRLRPREAWPHLHWPAPGPQSPGGLLKAPTPPLTRISPHASSVRLGPLFTESNLRLPLFLSERRETPRLRRETRRLPRETRRLPRKTLVRAAPLYARTAPLYARAAPLDIRAAPLHIGHRRQPRRQNAEGANGIWDSQAVTDLGTSQTRLRFTAGS